MSLLGKLARPAAMAVSTAILLAGWQLWARLPESKSPADILDPLIQRRFGDTRTFGMSRIALPPSVGRAFSPHTSAARDFEPENAMEARQLEAIEQAGWQVGFYTFGDPVRTEPASNRSYRALKGPAVLAKGTDRNDLPVWESVYPAARQPMIDFDAGRSTHRTFKLNGWTVVMRPVVASQSDCVACHNSGAGSILGKLAPQTKYRLGDVIGGVAYAFKLRQPRL